MAVSQIMCKVLGNTKSLNYKKVVQHLLCTFQKCSCNMSLKLHFLHSHLDNFSENLGAMSKERDEGIYQDTKTIEKRYRGWWKVNMMVDDCWCLMREENAYKHSQK